MIRTRAILHFWQNTQNSVLVRSTSNPLVNSHSLFFRQANTPINLKRNFLSLTLGNRELQRTFTSEISKVQPFGASNFRALIEPMATPGKHCLFVDKSLFIKNILDDSSEVILITRAKGFGKTLNMSMLHHFFSKEVDGKLTKELFDNLKISKYPNYVKRYQGVFPVIFLTFKEIKNDTFKEAQEDFYRLISKAYEIHEKSVLSNINISVRDKKDYELILGGKAPAAIIKSALKNLTYLLNKTYGVKPIVLIDDYDTPIQIAYAKNYYQEMADFMKGFFLAGLKDNSYLEKAVLTGILGIPKESIFSDFNNVNTYSLLDSHYEEDFGFTEKEVRELLKRYDLDKNIKEVDEWYNGYQIGNTIVYNPWSVASYVQEKGRIGAYWVNTSENSLIKDLLIHSSPQFKFQFGLLLQDKPIEILIDEHVSFSTIEKNELMVWSLMLMSGYLKAKVMKRTEQSYLWGHFCQLTIPNNETKNLYKKFIAEWLSGVNNALIFNEFINRLLVGNMENFETHLRVIMLQIFSIYDIKSKNLEKFFHGFMLGLFAGVDKNHYEITFNGGHGLDKYDIIIVPENTEKLGIIIEIQNIDKGGLKDLKHAAINAVEQLDDQYDMAALLDGIKSRLKIGIAFSDKELAIAYRIDNLDQKLTIGR